jgi:hypothetical protein
MREAINTCYRWYFAIGQEMRSLLEFIPLFLTSISTIGIAPYKQIYNLVYIPGEISFPCLFAS